MDYREIKDGLMNDYAPANAHERLLVLNVAAAWRRLEDCRMRERQFFDLQRLRAVVQGMPEEHAKREGAEVFMWIDKPHKAYDQICRAIRDSEIAFDRAIRRIEQVIGARKKEQIREQKAAVTAPVYPQPAQAVVGGSPRVYPISRNRRE